MAYFIYAIGFVCIVLGLGGIILGRDLLKMDKAPAEFRLILVVIPITFSSNTKFNGVFAILKGLAFIALGVFLFGMGNPMH